MARKVINVVYKVDDKELITVKSTIQGLEKATKASSDAMVKGNKQASTSIEGMTVKMQQLLAQIRLTNQADTQRISKLKAEYQQLKGKVDEFNKSLNDTNKTGQQGTGIFGGLTGAITAAFSIAALKQAISFTLEMNKLAGKVEGVKRAFDIAFDNAPLILDDLKKSTHGTVSEFELMQRTLQATNLGVSVDKLGVLFEFATVRAQQTGESVDYLVDSIVRGIGRKSVLVLDNLGLSAVRLKEQFGGVAIASKSVAEVTEGVAAIAKVELEKMGGYAETGAQKVDRVTVALENLKKQLAKNISGGGVPEFFGDVLKGLELMLTAEEDITKNNVLSLATDNVQSFLAGQKKTIDETIVEINSLEKAYFNNREEIKKLRDEFIKLRNEYSVANTERMDQIKNEIEGLTFSREVITKQIQLLNDYGVSVDKANKKVIITPGLIEILKDRIENLNDEITKATSEGSLKLLNEQLEKLNTELKRLQNLKPIDIKKAMGLSESLAANAENQETVIPDIIIPEDEEEKRFQDSLKLLDKYGNEVSKELKDQEDTRFSLEEEAAKERTRIADEEAANKMAAIQRSYDLAIQLGASLLENALMEREIDTQSINDKYERELSLAGDNDKAKEQIELERDRKLAQAEKRNKEAQKKNARTKIGIDTLVAVIKTMSEFGYPAGLIPSALMIALGAVSIARVNKYAKGGWIEGPGTSTSDSVPIMASKNEFMVKASAAQNSPKLLEAINERKIDDRVMRGAADGGRQVNVFDDSRIVNALEKNKVDYEQHAYTLMKASKTGRNFTRLIRSKVQGY